jgi:branched-chain amino acid transport system substrate-binding protein
LYNRGMYSAMLAATAAAKAQEIHGVKDITSGMMRDGLEALNVTNELMAAAGMPKFGPEFSVSCANHGGPGNVGIQQWDGKTRQWKLIGDFEAPDVKLINELIKADSEAYAAENNITPRDC